MKTKLLIESLDWQLTDFITYAKQLKNMPMNSLTYRRKVEEWSILECIAHLNRYSDYYLPAIDKAIEEQSSSSESEFKSGIIGGYMAKLILPKTKLNKMKTFAEMNPINSMIGKEEIDLFIENQIKMKSLLDLSFSVSLTKTMIPTTISRFIKMRLGDALQFLVNHTLRHIKQIEKIKM